jgi:hypothetical protein
MQKTHIKQRNYFFSLGILLFAVICILSSCNRSKDKPIIRNSNLNNYDYKRTKLLLNTVQKGAEIFQNEGIEALKVYEKTQRFHDIYFYIYRNSDAFCIYHGEDSTKINNSVQDQIDFFGKPIHNLIIEALSDTIDNPDAWAHFNWPRPDNIFPTWKTSCHRKVILKDGTEGYIGAGMYGYISEKEFIKISVKKACRLMTIKGDSSLVYIQSPQSPFEFFDCFIFVYDFNGNSIIDPSYKKNSKSNLLLFKDVTNHFPFKSIAEQLKTNDETWNMLQFTLPESMNIRKKVIYCRKTKLGKKDVIVGSMIDAPQSIWFK